MSFENEYHQDMKQLIQLLRKIIKNHTSKDPFKDAQQNPSRDAMQFNFFIFPLMAMTPEDMDEFEEILEQYFPEEGQDGTGDLRYELEPGDMDFLRKHGIKF